MLLAIICLSAIVCSLVNSEHCTCPFGYTGAKCETKIATQCPPVDGYRATSLGCRTEARAIKYLRLITLDSCRQSCESEGTCAGFEFVSALGGLCILRDNTCRPSAQPATLTCLYLWAARGNLCPLSCSCHDLYERSSNCIDGSRWYRLSCNPVMIDLRPLENAVVKGVITLPLYIEFSSSIVQSQPLRAATFPAGIVDKVAGIYMAYPAFSGIEDGALVQLSQLQWLTLNWGRYRAWQPTVHSFGNLTNLRQLKLDGIGCSRLEENIFIGLPSLRLLSVDNNVLSHFEGCWLRGPAHLEELSLAFNKLTTLSIGVFSGLNFLRSLNLASNQLKTIGADAFGGLNMLDVLDLSDNQFTSFPPAALETVPRLQLLDLRGAALRTLSAKVTANVTIVLRDASVQIVTE